MGKSLGFKFIRNMWLMGRVDEVFVNAQVSFNRITSEEAELILSATPEV